ncbi:MAG: NADH-quinone oxidoreductase subunit N [Myxococcales bacterium]|nr:NADH-quinone oxidoreductase subunit N [Myxococcales bacterium]
MSAFDALNGVEILAVDGIVAVGALGLLLADVAMPAGNKRILGYCTLLLLALGFTATFTLDLTGTALGGAYVGDGFAIWCKRIFLAAGFFGVLGGMDETARIGPRRQGEYYQLLMMSLLGMTLLAGARDLILLMVSFELMSLPLYAMAAWGGIGTYPKRKGPLPSMELPAKTKWHRPAEAGLKLYLVGAVSSVVALYGISLLFGIGGSTRFDVLARTMNAGPVMSLAVAMIVGGFAFKIGAAPFHMWVPDTYQGASTPFVAFLSVAPKAAGFAALVQLLLGPLAGHTDTWMPLVLALIIVSLLVGNLMAVPQQNVKRMLGFSGVAQMGFGLMALLAAGTVAHTSGQKSEGLATLLFFLAAYMVANMGVFFVIEAVAASGRTEDETADEKDSDDTLAVFRGLHARSPGLALAGLLFVLSLGGIPFAIGFWAKVWVLLGLWTAGYGWLVVLAAALSAAGLFYYLQIARSMYMTPEGDLPKVTARMELGLAILLLALLTMAVGLFPGPVMEAARVAVGLG